MGLFKRKNKYKKIFDDIGFEYYYKFIETKIKSNIDSLSSDSLMPLLKHSLNVQDVLLTKELNKTKKPIADFVNLVPKEERKEVYILTQDSYIYGYSYKKLLAHVSNNFKTLQHAT